MKKLFKKWFGLGLLEDLLAKVDKLEKEIENIVSKMSERALERMIGSAVAAAFLGKPETRQIWYQGQDVNDTRAALREIVTWEVRKEANATKEEIDSRVNSAINSEAFIDEIIERIKRKQL